MASEDGEEAKSLWWLLRVVRRLNSVVAPESGEKAKSCGSPSGWVKKPFAVLEAGKEAEHCGCP